MVTFAEQSDKVVCTFIGRMDTVMAMQLENKVDIGVRQAKKAVVFDLAAVEYVSSSFIRICLMVIKIVGKERFSMANASPAVAKIFNVAGLEEFLRKD